MTEFKCDSCGRGMEHVHYVKPGEIHTEGKLSSVLCPACWQKEADARGWRTDVEASKQAAFSLHGPCYCFDDAQALKTKKG